VEMDGKDLSFNHAATAKKSYEAHVCCRGVGGAKLCWIRKHEDLIEKTLNWY
jgi:hypothetical protein